MTQFASGIRWAKITFSGLVKDKEAISVVITELKYAEHRDDVNELPDGHLGLLVKKGILNREEFWEMVRAVDREMKTRKMETL